MNEVVKFTGDFHGRVEPDTVLEAAKGRLDDVVVIGWDKEGTFYVASSTGEMRDLLFLSRLLDRELMEELDAD